VTAYTVTMRQRRLCRDRTWRVIPRAVGGVREVEAGDGGDLEPADLNTAAVAGGSATGVWPRQGLELLVQRGWLC
jgi:hypothetical protein